MKYLLPLLLVFTSCVSRPKSPTVVLTPAPAPATESLDSLRYAEVVRSYYVGRYVDPNHSDVLHEQHPFYRVESTARWNLHPGTTGPGLLNPPRDPAYAPAPSNDAIVGELNRQKEATQRVMNQAAQLAGSYTELQQVIKDMTVVAKNHGWMGTRIVEAERRVQELELELRKLNAVVSAVTNETRVPPSVVALPADPLPVPSSERTNSPGLH